MKEILFRGRDIAHNWHYGVPLVFSDNFVCITAPHTYNKAVEPDTVGQYTGLTDKNGAKIFEGDIVKIDDKYIRYIEYSGECAAFVKFRYIDKLTSEFSGYLGKGYDNYKQTLEVIGNIHDTPELLEGGDDQ